jgi:hypothetical protein
MGFFTKKDKDIPADMGALVEKARISLVKHGIGDLKAAVYLVLDHSGSMSSYYRNGDVQKLAERALGLSANLDDDGIVPVVLFADHAEKIQEVSVTDYIGAAERLSSQAQWGGTNYIAAIDAMVEHYGKSGSTDPALVIFQTDGDPAFRAETTEKIRSLRGKNVFIAFVSFGSSVPYLNTLDNLGTGREDIVSHFRAPKPSQVTDEELYDGITGEFARWVKS